MGDHFNETEKFRKAAPCSEIFKTNLKTHLSPLLNCPQGCQGCQKNWKDLGFFTLVRFCTNIQLKLSKIPKNTKNPSYFDGFFVDFEAFSQFLQFWLNISAKTHQGEKS